MVYKINLKGHDLRRSIFRIFSLEYFLDSFISKTNMLVEVKKWDDPFENFIVKLPHQKADGTVSRIENTGYFGQCWTLNCETDFMWRVYTSDKENVKVKSSIKKLISSIESAPEYKLYKTKSEKSIEGYKSGERYVLIFDCSVGLLKYLPVNEFRRLNNSRKLKDVYFEDPLFIKRMEFTNEKEVRIILHYWDSDLIGIPDLDDHFSYKIDPNFLFDEIVFDPRIHKKKFQAYKDYLVVNGFKNPIRQSNLYRLPFKYIKT